MKFIKQGIAIIVAFIIIAGINIIAKSVIPFESNIYSPFISLFVFAMYTFFIVEFNNQMKNSSIAVGLAIGIIASLQVLYQYAYFGLEANSAVILGLASIVSLTLASYVFDIMYEKKKGIFNFK